MLSGKFRFEWEALAYQNWRIKSFAYELVHWTAAVQALHSFEPMPPLMTGETSTRNRSNSVFMVIQPLASARMLIQGRL